VLAHSLAAVSVNLQAAEGLLAAESLPADNPELVKAIECIERAGTLTREGLAAARRAILALCDDAAPLPDQLYSLAAQYRTAGDMTVNFTVIGEPRPLPEQAQLVAYHTGSSRKASPTARSPVRFSSARPRSRRTSTGSSPRPARVTAARPPATPTPTATPTRPPRPAR